MRVSTAVRPPTGLARPSCAGDYRISGYRLLMQFTGRVIDNIDHLAEAVQERGRACRRMPVMGRSILAAVFCNSARKAWQTADSSCLAREIAITCQGCIGESSRIGTIDGEVRMPAKICEGTSVT